MQSISTKICVLRIDIIVETYIRSICIMKCNRFRSKFVCWNLISTLIHVIGRFRLKFACWDSIGLVCILPGRTWLQQGTTKAKSDDISGGPEEESGFWQGKRNFLAQSCRCQFLIKQFHFVISAPSSIESSQICSLEVWSLELWSQWPTVQRANGCEQGHELHIMQSENQWIHRNFWLSWVPSLSVMSNQSGYVRCFSPGR